MPSADELKQRIEAALPGAAVAVEDLTGGGDHFRAEVVSDRFGGLSRIEQHKLVYDVFGADVGAIVGCVTLLVAGTIGGLVVGVVAPPAGRDGPDAEADLAEGHVGICKLSISHERSPRTLPRLTSIQDQVAMLGVTRTATCEPLPTHCCHPEPVR